MLDSNVPDTGGVLACETALMLMASQEGRPLTDAEGHVLHEHLAACARCLAANESRSEDDWRWLSRIPNRSLRPTDDHVIPVVDPAVFEIVEEVAAGGMGRILRARDRRLGREIAIKEVLTPEMQLRFERETLITARLQHPAIVPVYEAGTWPDGSGFFTMRLVPGDTLRHAIEGASKRERLALLPRIVAVTEAVAYAHGAGVIHRDLKPSNVLLGALGDTVVIDWGLAKRLGTIDDPGDPPDSYRRMANPAKPNVTHAGAVLGTPCFMAPEQARGEPLDERADVFALGAILYTLLAGRTPYAEELARGNSEAVIAATATRGPRPLDELEPDLARDLHAIVTKAMAFRAADRYPSAREMAEELRRFEAGQLLARQYSSKELAVRWLRRHRFAFGVTALALVAVAAAASVAVVNVTRSRAAERSARAVAEDARRTSEKQLAVLLEEQGRTAMVEGQYERALPYLTAALSRGRDNPSLRHMLGSTLRHGSTLVVRLGPTGTRIRGLAFLPSGELATLNEPSTLALWKDGAVQRSFALGPVERSWFAPDGSTVLVAGGDDTVTAWDVREGTRRWATTMPFPDESSDEDASEWLVAFSPSPVRIAVARRGGDGLAVRVLDAGSGASDDYALGTKESVTGISFSPDGGRLAAAGAHGAVRVWSLATHRELTSWKTRQEYGTIAFWGNDEIVTGGWLPEERKSRTPVERRAVRSSSRPIAQSDEACVGCEMITSLGENRLVFWQARGSISLVDGTDLTEQGHDRDLEHLAATVLSPDGAYIVGVGSELVLWRTQSLTRSLVRGPYDQPFTAAAWSADSQRFAAARADGLVEVWTKPTAEPSEYRTGAPVAAGDVWVAVEGAALVARRFDGAGEPVRVALPVAPERNAELQLSSDGQVAVVELSDEKPAVSRRAVVSFAERRVVRELTAPRGITLAPDGTRMLVHDDARDPHVVDTMTGREMEEQRPSGYIHGGLFLGGTERFVVWGGSAVEKSIPTLGTDAPIVRIDRDVDDAVLDPTGTRLVSWHDATITVQDVTSGAVVTQWNSSAKPDAVTFSASGGRIAVITRESMVQVHDLPSGSWRMSVPKLAYRTAAIDPSGTRLFAPTETGIGVWDIDRGVKIETIAPRRARVTSLLVSAGGRHLLVHGREAASVLPISLDAHSPEDAAALAEQSSWKLVDGALVRR